MKSRVNKRPHKGPIADPLSYAHMMKKLTALAYRSPFKHILGLNISGRYLDAGSGPGILAGMLAQANSTMNIVCLDISPEMIRLSQKHIESLGLAHRFDFVVGDVADRDTYEALGEFDLVYSTYALHHWEQPQESLQNLWRAVKPEGTLYVYDTRKVWWIRLIPSHDEVTESIRVSFTQSELRSILDQSSIGNYTIRQHFPFFISFTAIKTRESGNPQPEGGLLPKTRCHW